MDRTQSARGFSGAVAHQVGECADPRLVGGARAFRAGPEEHGDAFAVCHVGGVGRQARLADAGLTGHEYHLEPRFSDGLFLGIHQPLELGTAARETKQAAGCRRHQSTR